MGILRALATTQDFLEAISIRGYSCARNEQSIIHVNINSDNVPVLDSAGNIERLGKVESVI